MAKWADYLISGVWFANSGSSKHVSHVVLHPDNDNSVGQGNKKTKDEVINLIKNGKTFFTIRWNYTDKSWSKGAAVGYERLNGVEYLRTHPDASTADNIDNLLPMASLVC